MAEKKTTRNASSNENCNEKREQKGKGRQNEISEP